MLENEPMILKALKAFIQPNSVQPGQEALQREGPKIPLRLKAPEGQWQFKNGSLSLNGQDIQSHIQKMLQTNPSALSKLAHDLGAYRSYRIAQRLRKKRRQVDDAGVFEEELELIDPTGELAHLSALVEAYVAKIMRSLKKRYDETSSGMSFSLDEEGQLVLNGMNVTSFIEMSRDFPSQKALVFLKGFKERLAHMLSNKSRTQSYERLRETVQRLFDEIDKEIEVLDQKLHSMK